MADTGYNPHCPACNTDNTPGAKRCALCRRLLPGVATSNLKAKDYVTKDPAPAPAPAADPASSPGS